MKDKPLTKRKLLKDRQMPSPEQVNMRQNFNRISQDHLLIKKLLLKKLIGWTGGIIGAAAIVTAVVLNMNKPADKIQTPQTPTAPAVAAHKSCILSPLPAKEEPFAQFKISAKDGGIINYKTGSSIHVPANAFLSNGANPLPDSITIRYREFHDPLDIFLSGIPMNYDSAGTRYTLQSAGMLEILAFDGNQKLNLDPKKPIEIKMASTTDDTNYNLYQLDTVAKNWVYKGKDKIVTADAKNSTPPEQTKTVAETQAIADNSVKPALADPQKYCFKIGYDKTDFPELAAYDNVLFEVRDNTFKPIYYKINWSKISLQSGATKGTYLVKLKKADTTITVNAAPVFDPNNYTAALAKFDEKQKQVSEKQTKEDAEKNKKLNTVNKDLSSYNRKLLSAAINKMQPYRIFVINQMGVHNCDQPMPPCPMQVWVEATNKEDKEAAKISYSSIYLVEKGKNTVFHFMPGEPIAFDATSKKLMWTITAKNEIAFFRNVDYQKFSKGDHMNIKPVIARDQDMALAEIKKFSEE
ncbi:MAG: hypothetical protein JWP12_609 [Bacteroidetes bacterium]|nr:hypothetical protein [Bacteroidota bacterium]